MEEVEVKLLTEILVNVPKESYLYVGDYINSAFKDKFLIELISYSREMDGYKRYYDYCFELSASCVLYLVKEFEKDICLINYFCHYMIMDNKKVIMKVYDGHIFCIHNSLKISSILIQECERNDLSVFQEDIIESGIIDYNQLSIK